MFKNFILNTKKGFKYLTVCLFHVLINDLK